MDILNGLFKRKKRFVFPLVHFALTFLTERYFISFGNDISAYLPTIRKDIISYTGEKILVYSISKVIAFFIIFAVWNLIFSIKDKFISKDVVIIFGSLYVLGLFVGLFSQPEMFASDIDINILFGESSLLVPTYWHSIFTGAIYVACEMIIPFPFSLTIFRWLLFVYATGYIYVIVDKYSKGKKYKYFVFVLYLLPETYQILVCALRINYFVILCILYIGLILCLCMQTETPHKAIIWKIALLSGFISILRSEGILIGIGGMLALILRFKKSFKRCLTGALVFVAFVVFLSSLQRVGSVKYYGKDYSIVNMPNIFFHLFNSNEFNDCYDSAQEDMENIEAITPIEYLRSGGLHGFRVYNYMNGRIYFNQTLASDEASSKFMKSGINIILHNLSPFFKLRAKNFLDALGVPNTIRVNEYSGELSVEYYFPPSYEVGRSLVHDTKWSSYWENNWARFWVYSVILRIVNSWSGLLTRFKLNAILHVAIILLNLVLLFVSFFRMIARKGKQETTFFILFASVIATMVIVFLVMPESRATYLFSTLYSGIVLAFLYYVYRKEKEE